MIKHHCCHSNDLHQNFMQILILKNPSDLSCARNTIWLTYTECISSFISITLERFQEVLHRDDGLYCFQIDPQDTTTDSGDGNALHYIYTKSPWFDYALSCDNFINVALFRLYCCKATATDS